MIFMDQEFFSHEYLLRAVFPPWKRPKLWKKDGRTLTSAAFKDSRGGTSVDRTSDRSMEESVEYILGHLEGAIVSVSVPECRSIPTHIEYCPSVNNIFHSEIRKSVKEEILDDLQAKKLSDSAQIVHMPESEKSS